MGDFHASATSSFPSFSDRTNLRCHMKLLRNLVMKMMMVMMMMMMTAMVMMMVMMMMVMMMMVMMVMVMITLMNKIMIIKDEDRQSNFYKVRKNFRIEDNIRGMKIN